MSSVRRRATCAAASVPSVKPGSIPYSAPAYPEASRPVRKDCARAARASRRVMRSVRRRSSAGVASVIGGQLIQSITKAKEVTDEFNKAQKSIDFQYITDGLRKEHEQVSTLTDELDRVREALAKIRAARPTGVPSEFGFDLSDPGAPAEERRLTDLITRLEARDE